jgi:hypothetical protein
MKATTVRTWRSISRASRRQRLPPRPSVVQRSRQGRPSPDAPRTDPDERISRIRLLPRVFDGSALRLAARAPGPVTRLPRPAPGACVAGPRSPYLRCTHSANGCPALFAGFFATMAGSDFSWPCIIGFGSSPSRCGLTAVCRIGQPGDLRFPFKERLHMPGSPTTRRVVGGACDSASLVWPNAGATTRNRPACATRPSWRLPASARNPD